MDTEKSFVFTVGFKIMVDHQTTSKISRDFRSCLMIQCIQAKISKTLDKRSTLIFAANCTEQKLSSSESYYLTPNLLSRNAASFVALLFSKTPIWGHFGVCPGVRNIIVRQNHSIPDVLSKLAERRSVLTVPCVVRLPS